MYVCACAHAHASMCGWLCACVWKWGLICAKWTCEMRGKGASDDVADGSLAKTLRPIRTMITNSQRVVCQNNRTVEDQTKILWESNSVQGPSQRSDVACASVFFFNSRKTSLKVAQHNKYPYVWSQRIHPVVVTLIVAVTTAQPSILETLETILLSNPSITFPTSLSFPISPTHLLRLSCYQLLTTQIVFLSTGSIASSFYLTLCGVDAVGSPLRRFHSWSFGSECAIMANR
jgi:hypothetical protein